MFGGGPVVPAKKESASSGGLGKRTKQRFKQDAKDLGKALPRIPVMLAQEAKDIVNPDVEMPFEVARDPAKAKVWNKKNDAAKAARYGTGVSGAVRQVQDLPGVRLIPYLGTATSLLNKQGRDQLVAHPLYTLLDLAPAVGKIAKLATKGGMLAAEAEATARAAGKVAKAETIAKKGLNAKQAIGAVERRGEQAVAESGFAVKHPVIAQVAQPRTAARTIFHGGEQARDVARIGTEQTGKHARDVENIVDEMVQRRKATPDVDPKKLAVDAEIGAPGFRQKLRPQEAARLADYEDAVGRSGIKESLVAAGKGVIHGDEFYDQRNIISAAKAAERAQAKLDRWTAKGVTGRNLGLAKRDAKAAAAKLDRLASSAAPVRFKQVATELGIRDLIAKLPDDLTPEMRTEMVNRIRSGRAELAGFTKSQVQAAAARYSRRWTELRDMGYDPVYLHHVGVENLTDFTHPSIKAGRIGTESAEQARTFRPKPYVRDLDVARAHLDVEKSRVTREIEAVERIRNLGWMKEAAEVEPVIAETVGRLVGPKAGAEAIWDAVYKKVIKAQYDTISPRKVFGHSASARYLPEGSFYVPKGMGKVFEQIARPGMADSVIAKIMGKSHKALSWQVLYTEPSYYLGNLVTNAYLVTEGGGLRALSQMRGAFKMWRENRLPAELGRGANMSGDAERIIADLGVAQTMRELLGAEVGPVRNAAQKLEQKISRMAGFMDDMAQGTAYLEGQAKAARKGMTQADQHLYGLEKAYAAQGVFESLTPLERAITRTIAPYYPWSRFVLQKAWNLPFDHPMRAAILSSFTRAEVSDWDSDLPLRLRSLLFFSESGGKAKGISLNNFNPYAQVGNLITLNGVLGRTGPLIQAALSQVGQGVSGEGMDLFPNKRINPETGREEYDPPGFFRQYLESQAPRVAGVLNLIQADPELMDLREQDPEAFARVVRAQLGPVLSAVIPIDGQRGPMPALQPFVQVKEIDLQEERRKTGKARGRVERSRGGSSSGGSKVTGGPFG